MIRRIDHVSIPARDYAAAARFYQDVLGFTMYSEKTLGGDPTRRIGYLRPPDGETVIELVELTGGGTGYHYCLEVADFDAEMERLTAAGLRVVQPPAPTEAREPRESGWRRAVLAGPADELIELRG